MWEMDKKYGTDENCYKGFRTFLQSLHVLVPNLSTIVSIFLKSYMFYYKREFPELQSSDFSLATVIPSVCCRGRIS